MLPPSSHTTVRTVPNYSLSMGRSTDSPSIFATRFDASKCFTRFSASRRSPKSSARRALHIARSTVGRILKELPKKPDEPTLDDLETVADKPSRKPTVRYGQISESPLAHRPLRAAATASFRSIAFARSALPRSTCEANNVSGFFAWCGSTHCPPRLAARSGGRSDGGLLSSSTISVVGRWVFMSSEISLRRRMSRTSSTRLSKSAANRRSISFPTKALNSIARSIVTGANLAASSGVMVRSDSMARSPSWSGSS